MRRQYPHHSKSFIMTSIDTLPGHDSHPHYDSQLQELFATLREITQRHSLALPDRLSTLNDQQQRTIIAAIDPYCRFEFDQYPELHGLPVTVTGSGMLLLCNLDGDVIGAEMFDDTDVVNGTIQEICTLPIPIIDCLANSDGEEISFRDQVLSPVLILKDSVFKTDYSDTDGYETEHDLVNYQLGLPLTHYLHVTSQISHR